MMDCERVKKKIAWKRGGLIFLSEDLATVVDTCLMVLLSLRRCSTAHSFSCRTGEGFPSCSIFIMQLDESSLVTKT